MTKTRSIVFAALAGSIAAGVAQAATFSNFEAPTYTAGSTFAGVDDWTIYSGVAFRAKVTPATNDDTLALVPTVLEGSQSGFVSGTTLYRNWNGLESLIGDGFEVSWLVQADNLTSVWTYISENPFAGNTTIGVVLDESGNILLYAPDSGMVDSGFDYLADKTYRMSMTLDYDTNTMSATVQNLTDSGPVVPVGTVNYGNAFENAFLAAGNNGGLFIAERNGIVTVFDDITVSNPLIPEPATGALVLMASGLALSRRRREAAPR